MLWVYIFFIAFVLMLLALDLGVFHRQAHVVSIREALGWSAVWISIGLLFTLFIYYAYENQWFNLGTALDPVDGETNNGLKAAVKYLTGYVIEKSLSVDNIFVIAMIFQSLAIPDVYQHRVLFWGVVGALVLRGVMIGIGAELISQYHWILYLFGALLLVTAARMLLNKEHSRPGDNSVTRLLRRLLPVTDQVHGHYFILRAGSARSLLAASPGGAILPDKALERAKPGQIMLTQLAIALVLVETTDLIFAVDSIPAIFAITADPFIVFTSNVFAILGLRSLYFALAAMIAKFTYLKFSLAVVLAVVGVKMLFAEQFKALLGPASSLYLLLGVLVILAAGVIASLFTGGQEEIETESAQA